jgi:hypothetical protein
MVAIYAVHYNLARIHKDAEDHSEQGRWPEWPRLQSLGNRNDG